MDTPARGTPEIPTVPILPMPDLDELRSRRHYLGPAMLDLCTALVVHGINPDNMPRSADAITADGYLQHTGRLTPDGNDIEVRRHPWQSRTAWREIRPLVEPAMREAGLT